MLTITVVLLSIQTVLSRNDCTPEAVGACTQPMRQFKLENKAIFPQLYEGELDVLCKVRKDTARCLKPILNDCDVFQRLHFKGLEDAYDYICSNSAREIYFRNWHCLDNRKLLRTADRCNDTYQHSLRKLRKNIYQYGSKEIKKERCSYLNTYVSCIKKALEDTDSCVNSKEIAEWQYTIHQLALKGVAKEIDCEIMEPLLTTVEIVGIVIGGVAFIVLVILLIYFCTCNVARYRRNKTTTAYQNDDDKPIKPKKTHTVKISPPTQYVTEDDDDDDDDDDEQGHDRTYESFTNHSYTDDYDGKPTSHQNGYSRNGQLSSRTRESLKLQLPVTPTSPRKSILLTKSSDFDETESEASKRLPQSDVPAKKMRSKRGDKKRSIRGASDTDNSLVQIF